MNETLRLAEALISKPSVTPDDAGCQDLLVDQLQPLGFICERFVGGPDDAQVLNLWAKYTAPSLGTGAPAPLLVFAGHTDVVPTGPRAQWDDPQFCMGGGMLAE